MKKSYYLVVAALFMTATLQSCADDPVATQNEPTKITFTEGATATFTYTQLDSAEANLDHPMTDGADTLVQTTDSTATAYQGKTNVTKKLNFYKVKNERDTAYYWQDENDNLYIYNFGLDLVNGPTAQAVLDQRVDAGWVLAANMKAASNASWTAFDQSVNIVNFGVTAQVKDVVTANGTTPLTIGGKTVSTKKFTHVITATLPVPFGEAAKAEIEIYVAPEYGGIVRQVRKSAAYTLPLQPKSRATGADIQLISYVK